MKTVLSELKNINIIIDPRVNIPNIEKMALQPSIGTTKLFKRTPMKEDIAKPQKNKAFTLVPSSVPYT